MQKKGIRKGEACLALTDIVNYSGKLAVVIKWL